MKLRIFDCLNDATYEEEKKVLLIKKRILKYCEKEVDVFNCYRNLKNLEIELTGILEEGSPGYLNSTIFKIRSLIKVELDIVNYKIKHTNFSAPKTVNSISNSSVLKWTDAKIDLVELVYAIKMSINDGKASVASIAKTFETMFQVSLGNFYDIVNDIQIRKSERTRYIDRLGSNLKKALDRLDSK